MGRVVALTEAWSPPVGHRDPIGVRAMDMHSFRPSRWLLVCWIVGVTLVALAAGQATEGVCKVTEFLADRGFAAGFWACWLVGTLCAAAHFLSLRYALDGHYVTKASGVLWRHRRSIPLDKVTSIDVCQGPLEQILRIGQIRIYTPASGSDTPEETLVGVREPAAAKAALLRAAEAELQKASLQAVQETRAVRRLLDQIHRRIIGIERRFGPATPDGDPDATPAPAPAEDTPSRVPQDPAPDSDAVAP